MTDVIYRGDSFVKVDLEKIKVADLTFCRKNGPLIELLKKRGHAIAEQEFKEVHEYER